MRIEIVLICQNQSLWHIRVDVKAADTCLNNAHFFSISISLQKMRCLYCFLKCFLSFGTILCIHLTYRKISTSVSDNKIFKYSF